MKCANLGFFEKYSCQVATSPPTNLHIVAYQVGTILNSVLQIVVSVLSCNIGVGFDTDSCYERSSDLCRSPFVAPWDEDRSSNSRAFLLLERCQFCLLVDLDLQVVHRRIIVGHALHVEAEVLVGFDGFLSVWEILEVVIVDPVDEIYNILPWSRRHLDGDVLESQTLSNLDWGFGDSMARLSSMLHTRKAVWRSPEVHDCSDRSLAASWSRR